MAIPSTLVDRVKITINSSGTGPFDLGPALPAFRGVEALLDGQTYSYAVENGSVFEYGTGVYVQAAGQLLRSPINSSRGWGALELIPSGTPLAFTALAQDLIATGGDIALRGQLASSSGAEMVGVLEGGSVQTALDDANTRIDNINIDADGLMALGSFNRFMSKLDSQSADANIVIATDSTGNGPSNWPYLLFAGSVADAYPEWTILIRFWSGSAYAAATTLQTGTGSRMLTVWVAAVDGSIANRFAGEDFEPAILDPNPDVIMLSYGHNADIQGTGPYTSLTYRQLSWFGGIADALDKNVPNIPVILIGQNPTNNDNGSNPLGTDDGFMRRRLDILFPMASRQKWGVINVHDAFLQYPLPLADLLLDNTHPNLIGSTLWADVVWETMRASRGAQLAGAGVTSRLLKAWRSFADFDTWSKGNVEITEQTTTGRFDSRPNAATVTIDNTAGLGYMYTIALTAEDMPAVQGRWVNFAIWAHVPDSSEVSTLRVDMVDSGGTAIFQGPVRGDGFAVFVAPKFIAENATSLTINVYAAETAFSPASYFDADRASLSLGLGPIDPITAEDPVVIPPPAPPFRGALVKKNANQTGANYVGGANVAWDGESYDTSGFHDNVTNNSRLTVPSGVSRVRLGAQMRFTNGTAGEFSALTINKNGLGYEGQPYLVIASPTGAGSNQVSSPVLSVSPGDYFEANFQIQTDTSVDIQAGLSWFSIEVVE